MQQKLVNFVDHQWFQRSIIILIIANAMILGMETSTTLMQSYGIVLKTLDGIILKIFIIELLLKAIAYGWSFFKRPWCLFDICVIAIALIPSSGALSALRTLRVLRVLRLLSTVPTMRKVIEALLSAIPGIASVAAIMLIFFYVFAVIGTHLYGQSFPQWFGSIGETMYTLFQVMTLESWSMGIVRPVMEVHASAWIFFVLYILITTFTMLNLFIAIIVNAMHSDADVQAQESREQMEKTLAKQLTEMETRIIQVLKNN